MQRYQPINGAAWGGHGSQHSKRNSRLTCHGARSRHGRRARLPVPSSRIRGECDRNAAAIRRLNASRHQGASQLHAGKAGCRLQRLIHLAHLGACALHHGKQRRQVRQS